MASENSQGSEIPRRAFLKNLAAAAFVAPVVVSFGLEGIAGADSKGGTHPEKHSLPNQSHPNQGPPHQKHPNQCLPNQFFVPEQQLEEIISTTVTALQYSEIKFGAANSISEKALHALLELARCNERAACAHLKALVKEMNEAAKHSTMIANVVYLATSAQQTVCGAS